MELPTRYEPQTTEQDIYRRWTEARCFRATPDEREKRYCITIPPPNITGALHLGHALNNTIMDSLARWKRMQGYNTLVLPGTDHAGIATQTVVEREIKKQGLTRHDLGREKFIERVWEWKNEYGDRIVMQMQRLGCSYDWERLRFTMDEPYVDAILTVFQRWYDNGLIYLGERIVNWSPPLMTVISDIEVDYREEDGFLWHLRYPFTDGSGSVIVATTRPETMLGDTAVAVNPKDSRYAAQVGKTLTLPLVGREIPLIADDFVEESFGTGAVKITPFHDPNDYEAGLRHNLPRIEVIGPDAKMTVNAGEYAGLDRFEARKRIVADMEAQGFLVKTEPYRHSVGHCDRSGAVIEPRVSRQWFCKMAGTPMIARTVEAAASGDVRFVPDRYKELFVRWLENIRDWPISRQLWWGHRLPLWRKTESDPQEAESWICARTRAEAAQKLGGEDIVQSDDVLDTWFSSALWPFATLGWPQENDSLKYYYPTSLLSTAQEILYLWVARMVMTGEEFLGEKPFDDVYIHATILDEHGRRMSKSKGNGVDPVDLIDLYGADALRFMLAREAGQRQDIRIKPIRDGKQEQGEQARNFCNKLWNASRFALMNLEGFTPPEKALAPTALVDRWIWGRLQHASETVNAAFETYNLDDAARAIYEFFWDDFCDWYIEATKPRLQESSEDANTARYFLWFVLDKTLRLMHPILPFITERIWQSLPGARETAGVDFLMLASFPDYKQGKVFRNEFEVVQEVVRTVRNLQAENNLKKEIPVYFTKRETPHEFFSSAEEIVSEYASLIKHLTRCSEVIIGRVEGENLLAPTRYGDVSLPRPEASAEEIAAEKVRIEKELAKIEKDLSGLTARLENPSFVESAPEAVVAKARQQAAELQEKKAKLTERFAAI